MLFTTALFAVVAVDQVADQTTLIQGQNFNVVAEDFTTFRSVMSTAEINECVNAIPIRSLCGIYFQTQEDAIETFNSCEEAAITLVIYETDQRGQILKIISINNDDAVTTITMRNEMSNEREVRLKMPNYFSEADDNNNNSTTDTVACCRYEEFTGSMATLIAG